MCSKNYRNILHIIVDIKSVMLHF